jgi:hypothetical protein
MVNFTSINTCSHLLALPFSHSSTHSPTNSRNLSYSLDDIFCSIFTQIHILSYQPSHYSCLHIAFIFSFVAAKILFQWSKHNAYENRSYTNISNITTISIAALVTIFCSMSKCFMILRLFRKIVKGVYKLWNFGPSVIPPTFNNTSERIFMKSCVNFWVVLRRMVFSSRRFGTMCLFHLHRHVDAKWSTCLWRWNRHSVQKRRLLNTIRRRTT